MKKSMKLGGKSPKKLKMFEKSAKDMKSDTKMMKMAGPRAYKS